MPLIIIDNVHKHFGANHVLKGISLSIEAGEVIAVIGKSGSGKSTLLRCMNGLERVDSGDIAVCGHRLDRPDSLNLRALRKQVGILFQGYNLFPHVTVERNITLALTTIKKLSSAAAPRASDAPSRKRWRPRAPTWRSARAMPLR